MADALEGPVCRLLSSSGALGRGGGEGGRAAMLRRGPCSLPWPQQMAEQTPHYARESFRLSTSIYDFPVSSAFLLPCVFQEPKPADCHPISPPRAAPLDILDPNLGGGERQGGREVGRQGGHATELPVQQQNEQGARRKPTTCSYSRGETGPGCSLPLQEF